MSGYEGGRGEIDVTILGDTISTQKVDCSREIHVYGEFVSTYSPSCCILKIISIIQFVAFRESTKNICPSTKLLVLFRICQLPLNASVYFSHSALLVPLPWPSASSSTAADCSSPWVSGWQAAFTSSSIALETCLNEELQNGIAFGPLNAYKLCRKTTCKSLFNYRYVIYKTAKSAVTHPHFLTQVTHSLAIIGASLFHPPNYYLHPLSFILFPLRSIGRLPVQ